MKSEAMIQILKNGGYICHGDPGCAVHHDEEAGEFRVVQAHGMPYVLTESDYSACREMTRDELDEAFESCNPRTRTAYY